MTSPPTSPDREMSSPVRNPDSQGKGKPTVQRLKLLLKQLAAKHKRLKSKFTETQETLQMVVVSRDEAIRRAEQLEAATTAAALSSMKVLGKESTTTDASKSFEGRRHSESELEQRLDELTSELSRVTAERDKLKGAREGRNIDIDMARAREHAAVEETLALKKEIDAYRSDQKMLEEKHARELGNGAEEANALRAELESLKQKCDRLQEAYKAKTIEFDSLKLDLSQRVLDLESGIESAKNAALRAEEDLRLEKESHSATRKKHQTVIDAWEKERCEADQLKKGISESDLTNCESIAEESKLRQLKAEAKRALQKQKELKKALKSMRLEHATKERDLRGAHERCKVQMNLAMKQKEDLFNEEKKKSALVVQTLEQQCNELKEENKTSKDRMIDLSSQLETIGHKLEKFRKDSERWKLVAEERESVAKGRLEKIAKMEDASEAFKVEVEFLRMQLAEREETIEGLNREHVQGEALDNATKLVRELGAAVALDAEIDVAKAEMGDVDNVSGANDSNQAEAESHVPATAKTTIDDKSGAAPLLPDQNQAPHSDGNDKSVATQGVALDESEYANTQKDKAADRSQGDTQPNETNVENTSSMAKDVPGKSVNTSNSSSEFLQVYLKSAVFKYLTADEGSSERSALVPVISNLLDFSKEEQDRAVEVAALQSNESGVVGRVFGTLGWMSPAR